MEDRQAVVWTRATGAPRKLGSLLRAGDQIRFTYAPDSDDLPGISLLHDIARLRSVVLTWTSTAENPLPPMFQALVPPRDDSNLQRRLLLRLLEQQGRRQGGDTEWDLLLLGGRNAIGHLDVFRTDAEAESHYRGAGQAPAVDLHNSTLWRLVYEAALTSADPVSLDRVLDAVGTHPTPGGAMPKLLLPIVPPEGGAPVEALVKVQGSLYEDVLLMEEIGYRMFERIGAATPRHWLTRREDGTVALATERFDRAHGLPLPLESLYSTLFVATGGRLSQRWSEHTTAPSFDMVGSFFQNPKTAVSINRDHDAREFLKRIVMNLLIGNSDMHLENFAFLGARGQSRLSPVFDPAPTRGYATLRCVSVVSFGGLITSREDLPTELGPALLGLHQAFGVQKPKMLALVDECLEATRDYADLIRASGAKEHVTRALIGRLEGTRLRIEQALRDAQPHVPVRTP